MQSTRGSGGRGVVLVRWLAPVVALSLAGCHLIFPFGVETYTDASVSDAPVADGPAAPETASDAEPGDASASEKLAADADKPGDLAAQDGGGVLKGWPKAFGDFYTDQVAAVALDGSDNVYIAGYFYKSVDLGQGTQNAKGGYDLFVASFTATGAHRWSRTAGSLGTDWAYGLAVAGSNLYLVGRSSGDIDLGGGTLKGQGGSDLCIASYTTGGAHRWSKVLGGSAAEYGIAAAVDGAGNLYVAGSLASTSVSFGGAQLSTKGLGDIVLASYTPAGAHRWSKTFVGPSADTPNAVATAGSSVYVVGSFYGAASLGGGTLTSKGSSDVFVAAFDTNGAPIWSKGYGGASLDGATGVALDASENLYVTGQHHGGIDFGGGSLPTKGSNDVFLASLTKLGAYRWAKSFGATYYDQGYGVAVGGKGDLYLTGRFYQSVDFGGGALSSKGEADIFVASYAQSGAHRWSKSFGAAKTDDGLCIAASAQALYAGGWFRTTVDFGGTSLTSKGGYDAVVFKLAP